jgi:hypothetical protein
MTVPEPAAPPPSGPPPVPSGDRVDAALLEALDDLAHDLGRHIRLPLALLPIDAPAADVEAAVERAIRRTRTGPRGVVGADELLSDFLEDVPALRRADCEPLVTAVAQACDLARTRPLPDRERLRTTFEAVATAIAALGVRWRSTAAP